MKWLIDHFKEEEPLNYIKPINSIKKRIVERAKLKEINLYITNLTWDNNGIFRVIPAFHLFAECSPMKTNKFYFKYLCNFLVFNYEFFLQKSTKILTSKVKENLFNSESAEDLLNKLVKENSDFLEINLFKQSIFTNYPIDPINLLFSMIAFYTYDSIEYVKIIDINNRYKNKLLPTGESYGECILSYNKNKEILTKYILRS